jgi:hypothetical protein
LTNSGDPVEGSHKRRGRAPSTNPDNIIQGPRKRKPASWVTDLHAAHPQKKQKPRTEPKAPTLQVAQLAQSPSAENEDVEVEVEVNLVQHTLPTKPTHSLELEAPAADNSNDEDDLEDRTTGKSTDDDVEEPAEVLRMSLVS